MASKIVEKLVLNGLEPFLYTTSHQFGFKMGHSTDSCVFALKQVINYYRNLGTPVFLCFVDIKVAFDRLSTNMLFCLLYKRRVPKYLIYILLFWYRSQKLFVRCGSSISHNFGISNGIRQGSCLSPYLFSVYVNELNINLKNWVCPTKGNTAPPPKTFFYLKKPPLGDNF